MKGERNLICGGGIKGFKDASEHVQKNDKIASNGERTAVTLLGEKGSLFGEGDLKWR